MANKTNSMAHTKWMCKYHIVFTPKYRRKIIYNQYKESIRDISEYISSFPVYSSNLPCIIITQSFKDQSLNIEQ
jgi:REP element-mobilizing transposase RayT